MKGVDHLKVLLFASQTGCEQRTPGRPLFVQAVLRCGRSVGRKGRRQAGGRGQLPSDKPCGPRVSPQSQGAGRLPLCACGDPQGWDNTPQGQHQRQSGGRPIQRTSTVTWISLCQHVCPTRVLIYSRRGLESTKLKETGQAVEGRPHRISLTGGVQGIQQTGKQNRNRLTDTENRLTAVRGEGA